ncbi:hypothetical protein [Allomesorhizobium camelthorni]|uniref:Uncharacterized protein n=1 Tax=Allomesorhizobium camelthorni TaxID=475069 RepID=A0A6G4WFN4_9HYPH|nr:hypothetical protein [Mesorhizobium camelthorni]NGO53003.1 hypothetical protein [Mesorhizobium camelthorni]
MTRRRDKTVYSPALYSALLSAAFLGSRPASALARFAGRLLSTTSAALLVIEPVAIELARAQQTGPGIVADPNAAAGVRPTIGTAANGVPIVDIARAKTGRACRTIDIRTSMSERPAPSSQLHQ